MVNFSQVRVHSLCYVHVQTSFILLSLNWAGITSRILDWTTSESTIKCLHWFFGVSPESLERELNSLIYNTFGTLNQHKDCFWCEWDVFSFLYPRLILERVSVCLIIWHLSLLREWTVSFLSNQLCVSGQVQFMFSRGQTHKKELVIDICHSAHEELCGWSMFCICVCSFISVKKKPPNRISNFLNAATVLSAQFCILYYCL